MLPAYKSTGNLAADLAALTQQNPGMFGNAVLPVPTPMPPIGGVNETQIRTIMQEELAKLAPNVQGNLNQALEPLRAMFNSALADDDLKQFKEYLEKGAPGFGQLLASDKLYPIAQLLWETIKENTK